jgi:hypothetical protein
VGSVLFGLLMLPIVIAALQPLALDALTQPIAQVFERIVGILPTLASAAVIVVLAALAGRALATLTTALAAGLGLNRLPAALGLPDRFRMGGRDASELAGTAVLIGVLALGIIQAAELLGLRALTQALQALGLVGAQLASGLVVLLAGAWIAAVVARGVRATDGPHAATLALAARVVILAFTVALGLRQAGLPAEIVAIAFAALIGAVAVAFAVAVGLGARPAAERLIDAAVARWQGSPPTPDPGPGPSVGTVVASAAAPAPPERLDGPHGT